MTEICPWCRASLPSGNACFFAFGAMAQKAAPEFNGKNGAVIDANKISGVFKSAIVVEDKILDDAEMSVNVCDGKNRLAERN